VITNFLISDKSFPIKNKIELSHTENFLSFEFAALNYVSTEKNQYAYKMEGVDKDWVYSGTRRFASYPNLDPGEYIFRVKGSNNDAVWNEAGTSITIIITPPWWKTWWFMTFFWVTVAGSIGGTLRYVEKRKLQKKIERLERERALEKERVRISQDMHDEVGSSLSEISILSELLKRDMDKSEKAELHLRDISERSAEVIENIGQIIWAINPRNDPLDNLVAHLRLYAADYIRKADIKYRFEIPDNIPEYHLSAEVRRNVFLVVKETLHNIVKHACASEVQVRVDFLQRQMIISVKDNGKGFSIDQSSGSGNGLINMQKRTENIGGIFKIESVPGQGTSITVTVNFIV
jgi:signal transduction histidine kinase